MTPLLSSIEKPGISPPVPHSNSPRARTASSVGEPLPWANAGRGADSSSSNDAARQSAQIWTQCDKIA